MNLTTRRLQESKQQYTKIYQEITKLYSEVMLLANGSKISYAQSMVHLRKFNRKLYNIREKLHLAHPVGAGGSLKIAASSLYFLFMNMQSSKYPLANESDFHYYHREYMEWMKKTEKYLDEKVKKEHSISIQEEVAVY